MRSAAGWLLMPLIMLHSHVLLRWRMIQIDWRCRMRTVRLVDRGDIVALLVLEISHMLSHRLLLMLETMVAHPSR